MSSEYFPIGQRIRINYWADKRESGWMYGTVIGEPVNMHGSIAQNVKWDSGYETLTAIAYFERVA